MFLSTVNFLACISIANSAVLTIEKESQHTKKHFTVPQEIRDLVPVDFAASNLRKFRLKNQSNQSFISNQTINEIQESSSFNATTRSKEKKVTDRPRTSTKPPKFRIKPDKGKFSVRKKSPRSRIESFSYSSSGSSKPKVVHAMVDDDFENEKPLEDVPVMKQLNSSVVKKHDNFEKIRQAIQALPQQLVKIERDQGDCDENSNSRIMDVRGPPCSFSIFWSIWSGDPWFSPNSTFPRKWRGP